MPTPTPTLTEQDPNAYYLATAHFLIAAGNQLIHQLVHEPDTEYLSPQIHAERVAQTFERVATAVRRTILLARKLAEPIPAAATAPTPEQRRTADRKQVLRKVQDLIQLEHEGPTAEALRAELGERLEMADFEHDLATKGVDQLIQDIANDLNVDTLPGARGFPRRTPADIVQLAAAAAAPARHPAARPGPRIHQAHPPPA